MAANGDLDRRRGERARGDRDRERRRPELRPNSSTTSAGRAWPKCEARARAEPYCGGIDDDLDEQERDADDDAALCRRR